MQNRLNATLLRRFSVIGSLASLAAFAFSCSSKTGQSEVGPDNGAGAQSPTTATGGAPPSQAGSTSIGSTLNLGGEITKEMPGGPCDGLECAVQQCTGTTKTTITGKVYDPAGKLPLYNVAVYVPNAPVLPFKEGVTCDRCDASILNPVTSAITDETGTFVLNDAPVGTNIPLVIQVGKWRRQITIPTVTGCVDNPLTDPQVTRLPRNKAEGDIPKMAIAVGGADQMECLPLRMGIDPAEFTPATGDGRIHLYIGDYDKGRTHQPVMAMDAAHGAAALTPASDLWASTESLMKYDITVLSCEGDAHERQKPMTVRQAMYDYESAGGRVFASHWHNIWFEQGPNPLPTTGTWNTRMPNPAGNAQNENGDGTPQVATINQTFPKGEALAKWLLNVGASTMLGNMDVAYPRDNIQAVNPDLAREWITVNNPNFPDAPKAVQYMSFNTPIGAAEDMICGRAVYTDLHVASIDDNTTANAQGFPASCEMRDLSAQEKAVAFMLFDLSACVQSEDKPVKPPK
ncbi:MAG: hypothetical protein ABUL60_23205 [Myxococcales bacterium]